MDSRLLFFLIVCSDVFCYFVQAAEALPRYDYIGIFHDGGQACEGLSQNQDTEKMSDTAASSTVRPSCYLNARPRRQIQTKRKEFYWYAMKLSSREWKVLRNGDVGFEAFERNIERHCKGNQSFGFSFTAVQTNRAYIDCEEDDMSRCERQWVLEDIFYTCWGTNGTSNMTTEISGHESDKFIFKYLSANLLNFLPEDWRREDIYSQSKHRERKEYCLDPNGLYELKPSGVEACFFYVDVNSMGILYGGIMTFNKIDLARQTVRRSKFHADWRSLYEKGMLCTNPDGDENAPGLREGECIKYISRLDYFLFCCCYHNPELCSYDSDSLRRIKANLNDWRNNPVETAEIFDNESGVPVAMPYRSWTFRHFIYSTIAHTDKKRFVGSFRGNRIRNIHCALGEYTLESTANWKTLKPSIDWRFRRHEYDQKKAFNQFCTINYEFIFKHTDLYLPEKIHVILGGAAAESCEEDGCSLIGPMCFNDLIYHNETKSRFQCCCREKDLCNHRGPKEITLSDKILSCASVTKSVLHWLVSPDENVVMCSRAFDCDTRKEIFLMNGTSYYTPFSSRRGKLENFYGCYLQQAFPLTNIRCSDSFPIVTFQFINCECVSKRNSRESKYLSLVTGEPMCDREFSNFSTENINQRPLCLSGTLIFTILQLNSTESLDDIVKENFAAKETIDFPICVDEVSLFNKTLFTYVSGTLTEFVSEGKIPMERHERGGLVKRFALRSTRPKESVNEVQTLSFLCQSNTTDICNGPANFRLHLLPEFIERIFGRKSFFPKTYLCDTFTKLPDGSMDTEECEVNDGCFYYRSLVTKYQTGGCLSSIFSHIESLPKLRAALTCEVNQKEKVVCQTVEDITYDGSLVGDVLCCCHHGTDCSYRVS